MAGEEKAEGLHFTTEEAQIAPPLSAEISEEEEELGEVPRRPGAGEAAERVARQGKIPLHPAVIRLPASILGRVGTELTGYPGFTFTEQELNDLADLWMQCGIEMNPLMQASIGTTAMLGGKSLGYFAWVKSGKPAVIGAKDVGETLGEGDAI